MRIALLVYIALFAGRAVAEDGVVDVKDYNFQISTPPDSIDWEIVEITEEEKKRGLRAHLLTEWADSDPPARADVWVMTWLMNRQLAKLAIENVAAKWKDSMEAHVENARDRKESKETLGGIEGYAVDVTGNHATFGGICRRQYWFVKNGKYLYVIFCDRSYDAVDDEDLDDELKEILGSFKFHEVVKVEGDRKGDDAPPEVGGGEASGGSKENKIDPERLKREEIEDKFWKYKCIKPDGLVRVPAEKFDPSEKANGCKLKFEHRKEQSLCMIRVYVASLKSGQVYSVERLADSRIKYYEKKFKKNMRQPPKIDKRWKLGPLTKDAVSVKLVGRRATTEIEYWYIADCKNDRQYQIQIYMTGTTAERLWKNQVDAFMKSFEPLR
jgi:hypothetical protein